MSDYWLDEKVFSMILDLMQLESSFVSADINAVYHTRTYVPEIINTVVVMSILEPLIRQFMPLLTIFMSSLSTLHTLKGN